MEYRLEELFDLQMGKTPSRSVTEYWESGNNKWISIADLSKCGKYIYDTKECLSDIAVSESGIKQIPANTVVMSFKLSIGKTAITSEPKVNIHSMQEQQEIVYVLNQATALIELHQQQLQKLDELVKARFVELFGDLASPWCKWQAERLADVCKNPDDIKCGPFGTQLNKDEYVDSGVAVWEIPQINSAFATLPTHYVTTEKAKLLDSYSVEPGDIAMSRKGNVGKCAVFPPCFKPGIIHSDVLRIRVDSNRVLPIFMMHQLHYSGSVQRQIEMVSSGAIMAGINVTKLQHILVHVPPIELQTQFAAFVEQVNKSKVAVQKSLDEAQLLFDSLMQQYFE